MFEGFDDVSVPDQWDEIAARAAGPSGPAFEPGGHRRAILVTAAAAVIGLAGVLWIVSDDGDDLATVDTPAETSAPASTLPVTVATVPPTSIEPTQPPTTTVPLVTVAETVPPLTTASPTTAPSQPTSTCTEVAGDPDSGYEDDPALDRFGPLGAAPVLDISTRWPDVLTSGRDVTRVSGGTAILLQTRWPESPRWSLTVVNDDGTVRWRRCGDLSVVQQLYAVGRVLVLAEPEQVPNDPNPPLSWHAIDVSTGANVDVLDALDDPIDVDRLSAEGSPGAPRFALFGISQLFDERGEPLSVPPDASLHLLDAVDMSMTDVPYPPGYYTGERPVGWIELVETSDSDSGWILKQFADEYPTVASVFVDGAWTTDPVVIRRVVPVVAYSPYGIGSAWSGVDPVGETIWTLPDKAAYWIEGAEGTHDGGVDLLGVCERYDTIADGGFACVSPSLVGVDGESGAVVWELPGHRMFGAIGDGYALITDGTENIDDGTPAATWQMIDTATGEPVDGQSWSFETFEEDYSEEEDGVWVGQHGGVVLAVNGEHIRVWFPEGMSGGTVSVSLAA